MSQQSYHKMFDMFLQRSDELKSSRPSRLLKLWPTLNQMMPFGGMPLEDNLVFLLAYAGTGKSYCAINFFLYPYFIYGMKPRTLFFSMDMNRIGFTERLASMIVGANFSDSRYILKNDFKKIEEMYAMHKFDNFLSVSFGAKSIKKIQDTIEEYANSNQRPPELIIIDHIQVIPGGDTEPGMAAICNALKTMKGDYECMFLVVSQVARPMDMKDKKLLLSEPPLLMQAKGSGAIDYACDYALAISHDFDAPLTSKTMKGRIKMVPRKMREDSGKVREMDKMMKLYYAHFGILEEIGNDLPANMFTTQLKY